MSPLSPKNFPPSGLVLRSRVNATALILLGCVLFLPQSVMGACPLNVVEWGSLAAETPLGLTNIIAVAAGGGHSLALRSDGTVVGWGYDFNGQATPPENLSNVVAIAAGDSHSLALKNNGSVVGWGNTNSGATTPPTNLTGVIAISAGDSHSLALKNDGTVVAWGEVFSGQITVPTNLSGSWRSRAALTTVWH